MLVSPTEHGLKRLGKTSSLPERYGADFLFPSIHGLVGIQRKEIKDLVASLRDGRLSKELGQMSGVSVGIVVIEGEVRWTTDGGMVGSRSAFTRTQYWGVVFSLMFTGLWVVRTDSLDDTAVVLPLIEKWLSKKRHGSLSNRPNGKGEWGTLTSREWGVHFYQGFPGIGATTAAALYDQIGIPLRWTVKQWELEEVPGVGKGRSEMLYKALGQL